MRRVASWIVAVALVVAALPAAAEEASSKEPAPKRTQVVTFNDVVLDGGIDRPEITVLWRAPPPGFTPMIPIRADFQPELERSADQL